MCTHLKMQHTLTAVCSVCMRCCRGVYIYIYTHTHTPNMIYIYIYIYIYIHTYVYTPAECVCAPADVCVKSIYAPTSAPPDSLCRASRARRLSLEFELPIVSTMAPCDVHVLVCVCVCMHVFMYACMPYAFHNLCGASCVLCLSLEFDLPIVSVESKRCVCIYVCTYACSSCTQTHTCTGVHTHVLASTRMYWRPHACTGVHTHVLASTRMYWRPHTCTGVHTHVLACYRPWKGAPLSLHTYMYTHVHAHMYLDGSNSFRIL
jgi:hypothetical protein